MLPDGTTTNEIEQFISTDRSIFEDITALKKFTTGSDHNMLRAKIHLDKRMQRKKHTKVKAYGIQPRGKKCRETKR